MFSLISRAFCNVLIWLNFVTQLLQFLSCSFPANFVKPSPNVYKIKMAKPTAFCPLFVLFRQFLGLILACLLNAFITVCDDLVCYDDCACFVHLKRLVDNFEVAKIFHWGAQVTDFFRDTLSFEKTSPANKSVLARNTRKTFFNYTKLYFTLYLKSSNIKILQCFKTRLLGRTYCFLRYG